MIVSDAYQWWIVANNGWWWMMISSWYQTGVQPLRDVVSGTTNQKTHPRKCFFLIGGGQTVHIDCVFVNRCLETHSEVWLLADVQVALRTRIESSLNQQCQEGSLETVGAEATRKFLTAYTDHPSEKWLAIMKNPCWKYVLEKAAVWFIMVH